MAMRNDGDGDDNDDDDDVPVCTSTYLPYLMIIPFMFHVFLSIYKLNPSSILPCKRLKCVCFHLTNLPKAKISNLFE